MRAAGVRRSHVDVWLIPLLESQDTSFQAAPVYYDYQAFVQHTQRNSKLRLGIFGSDDRLRLTSTTSGSGGQFDQGIHGEQAAEVQPEHPDRRHGSIPCRAPREG